LFVSWFAAWAQSRMEDEAMTWVNKINTATDEAEVRALLPGVERWLSRSDCHVCAYLHADVRLAAWERFYDPATLPPMTESEERERGPMPADSAHNVKARRRLRALCQYALARRAESAQAP
jgi:hypothetical protein